MANGSAANRKGEFVVMEALMAGAADFVVKPFEQDRPRAAVERILSTD